MESGTARLRTDTAEAPPVSVSKLGFHVVTTPDVAAIAEHYERGLRLVRSGEEDGTVYLTTGGDHHSVAIRKGDPHGRAGLGFEVHGSLAETGERLRAAGVGFEHRTDPEPGIAAGLVIAEFESGTPITLYEAQESSGEGSVVGVRPAKLGHIASYVEDLAAGHEFYLGVLGFRWADTIGDFFSFLRCNADHHAVNMMTSTKRAGLHHVAYEMRDFMHLKEMLDHLATRDIRMAWGPGRHGVGHNIFTYHADPDGNFIELFTELDVIADDETGVLEPRPWHEEWPQGPKFWSPAPGAANKWGWINPDFLEH
ncbi:MAG: VOC family protein [Actinobacteria bacterium]|nr:VOC family protein [Actinomycetota bacterium]